MANQANSGQIDYTYANENNFRVIINKMPKVSFFALNTFLPEVSSPGAGVAFPTQDINIPDDKLIWAPLDVGFVVDEGWFNYEEVFRWMEATVMPRNTEASYIQYSDALIMILDNLKSPVLNVKFASCFPVTLSQVAVKTTDSTTLFGSVSLRYSYYTIDRVSELTPPIGDPPPILTL
jgi:hypothetical protein